jgi:hypothetical protein
MPPCSAASISSRLDLWTSNIGLLSCHTELGQRTSGCTLITTEHDQVILIREQNDATGWTLLPYSCRRVPPRDGRNPDASTWLVQGTLWLLETSIVSDAMADSNSFCSRKSKCSLRSVERLCATTAFTLMALCISGAAESRYEQVSPRVVLSLA